MQVSSSYNDDDAKVWAKKYLVPILGGLEPIFEDTEYFKSGDLILWDPSKPFNTVIIFELEHAPPQRWGGIWGKNRTLGNGIFREGRFKNGGSIPMRKFDDLSGSFQRLNNDLTAAGYTGPYVRMWDCFVTVSIHNNACVIMDPQDASGATTLNQTQVDGEVIESDYYNTFKEIPWSKVEFYEVQHGTLTLVPNRECQ